MGYDMHWRVRPSGEADEVAEADARFYEAARERDALGERGTYDAATGRPCGSDAFSAKQAKVDAALAEIRRIERSYFRLNVWGMGRYRVAMESLGMLCGADRRTDCPDPESFGTSYDEVDALRYRDDATSPPSGDAGQRAKTFLATEAEFLSQHDGECPGIPPFKFGSNDGWIVTPAECKAALALYSANSAEQVQQALADAGITDTDYWSRWIEYLSGAVDHDGFEVH